MCRFLHLSLPLHHPAQGQIANMLLTDAQPTQASAESTFAVFSSLTIFWCRLLSLLSASPLPPFRSLPPACLSPNPPAPPQNRSSASPVFPVAAHGQNTSPKAVAKSVRKRSNPGPAQVSLVPFFNRFSTDLQPICNRFSTDFQPRSPTTTDLQPIFNRAPNPQPFLNRFSTVFQPFFNRFSTDFQLIAQPIFNRVLKLVALSGHNALETPVCFTKKRGGKDASEEGRDGSEQRAQEQQTPQSPPPTLLQLVGKGRGPGMQFDPEQQGKVMFHQCPLLEISPGKENDLP